MLELHTSELAPQLKAHPDSSQVCPNASYLAEPGQLDKSGNQNFFYKKNNGKKEA